MKNMMMIGNAHIDPVWFWRWQEGYHEIKATFRSALDRLDEFPDFLFTCACASYYQWVEENDPEMFEEITTRVAQGRWVIVGGMWIQPDMNTPSGESIVRQLLHSQRYFAEKFGRIASIGYNVDSFGHNAMLPQLLRRAGMEGYVWMRPSIRENPDIPEGALYWQSPDGSRIPTYRIEGEYTGARELPAKIDRLFKFSDRTQMPVMCFYGVGNHGGGPTIENLEQIESCRATAPRGEEITYASPIDYFQTLRDENAELPVWHGELQHHASGCYSTHSASKIKHRTAENALFRQEKLCILARTLTGHKAKDLFVRQAWDNLMINEFHDIMGGCSTEEALDDVIIQLNESISIAAREENAALQKISWRIDTIKGVSGRVRSKQHTILWGINGLGTPVVVFNPHAFEARGPVQLLQPLRTVKDDDGNSMPVQIVRAARTNGSDDCWDSVFHAIVPPMGYRLYWVFPDETETIANPLCISNTLMENAHIRAEFDPETGALTALIHKASGSNVIAKPTHTSLVDITHCDSWAHDIFKFDKPAGEFANAQVTILQEGPVRAVLQVVTRFGKSELDQRYTLYADSDQLEVDVRLNLCEHYRMVKLCFPTVFTDGHDVSEIPYGVLERKANGDEEHCQRWTAMQGETGGLAVLNNGKYSYSAEHGELRLTIANSSIYADHFGQGMRDNSCVFMDQGTQRFVYALCPYAGSWRDAKLGQRSSVLNQPLPYVVETYHEGALGGSYQGISLENPKIALGAFKRAENGKGYILRFSETSGVPQSAHVELTLLGRTLTLSLDAFEIKTLFVPDDESKPICNALITELDID